MKINLSQLTLISALTCVAALPALANTPPPAPVKVDTVTETQMTANTELMATLHSQSHVPINASVGGLLLWIVEPGTFVHKGDPLIKLDLTPLELQRQEQQAAIQRASVNLKYQQNEVTRLTKLRHTNATSQFQLDQAQSQYELALADIELAKVRLKQVEEQIGRAIVRAPYDGVITERFIQAGTDINRSDALLSILDTEQLEARLFIPVKYLANIKKGLPLNLNTPQQQMTLPITAVIPSADARSQTFEVRIKIPADSNEHWTAGQLVKASIPTQSAEPSLTVHRDALLLRKDGVYVVTIDADNVAHRLQVQVGKGNADRVSITGALKQGDRVAIRGAERLREGQNVTIQN